MLKYLFSVLIFCFCTSVSAEKVKVAVASNFMLPMKKIAAEFEKETGHKVVLSFGSSGKIFAQIKHGAPFHVFFSADQEKPSALKNAGKTVAGSRFTYAIGTLVLWSTNSDFNELSQNTLIARDYNKIALANPKLAPYGAAAEDVLSNLGLLHQVSKVYGENISQTFQFVLTGNADLGFISKSQLIGMNKKDGIAGWEVPKQLYSPIKQDAVLLDSGKNNKSGKGIFTIFQVSRNPKNDRVIWLSGTTNRKFAALTVINYK